MKKQKPVHHIESPFEIIDNKLIIGGSSIDQLAQRIAQTPFYAYDRNRITEQIKKLRNTLPSDIKIHYAIKANPMPAVVQHLSGLVDGFDLASLGEMQVALDTTMPTSEISFAGPGKSEKELSAAIAAQVTINMESFHEMETISMLSNKLKIKAKVAIRVNPDFELKASGMKMGGGPKQFGVDAERVPEMLKKLETLDLEFQGFHIFSGSQNLKPEAIIEAQQKTFDLAIRLSKYAPSTFRSLNIGGGFGIPYFPGEYPLDLSPIADNLKAQLPNVKSKLPDVEIIIELGRYIVGEAGVYVCKIIDKKISRGHVFYIADGGLHHHLAASGNFGQIIRKNYPVVIGNKVESNTTENASIVGPLCTPLDILGDKIDLPIAEIGDYVVVHQSGAYGYSASPKDFLSQPQAIEVLV